MRFLGQPEQRAEFFRIDVAFLSDHPTHADEAPLAERLLERDGDELVLSDEGQPVGAWLACPDGHRTLMLPGVEGDLMPFALEADVPEARSSRTPESVAALKAAGGVVWQAHTEERTYVELEPLGLDGIELYQLQANLDPGIREEFLGLDPLSYLGDIAPFFFPETQDLVAPPHPDLAPLGFVELNEPSTVMLEALGQTQRIAISGGTDAHQNVFNTDGPDGERIDSYRRMMRWFNTRLRVELPLTPDSAREALREARTQVVFEVFGTPQGFDFRAEQGDTTHEIGAEIQLADGLPRLKVELPELDPRSPRSASVPDVRGLLYRATPEGRELVQDWTEGSLEVVADVPGVYRVEVWITPLHLEPYLGELGPQFLEEPVPWVLTGAFFVRGD